MKPAKFDPQLWKALHKTFSRGRLNYYLGRTEQNPERAFWLLQWNTLLSESLYVPLQAFEIALRNALDEQIRAYHLEKYKTEAWYGNGDETLKWLKQWCNQPSHDENCTENERRAVKLAKKYLTERRPFPIPVTHANFVASTSFGLWVSFLSRHYTDLWNKALHKAFRKPPAREFLWSVASQANRVRNRVAHYEPVVVKDNFALDELHKHLLYFLGLLCPETAGWIRVNSRFQEVWEIKEPWWRADGSGVM
jgi:Abi-like protein